MSRNARDASVELYRVLLAYGICLLHTSCQGPLRGDFPWNVLNFTIPGFLVISGYYGINFSVGKVVKLYSVAIYSLIALSCMNCFSGVFFLFEHFRTTWFLNSYLLVMAMAPLANVVFDQKFDATKRIWLCVPFFCAVFGWGFALRFNCLRDFLPPECCLTTGSAMTLLGLYLLGRCIRFYDIENRLSNRWWLIGFLCSIALIVMSGTCLAAFNSPVSAFEAICLFCLVKKLRLNPYVARIVRFVAPSTFTIYIIHGVVLFPGMQLRPFELLNWLTQSLFRSSGNRLISMLLAALAVFVLALILDLPRRGLSACFKRMYPRGRN